MTVSGPYGAADQIPGAGLRAAAILVELLAE